MECGLPNGCVEFPNAGCVYAIESGKIWIQCPMWLFAQTWLHAKARSQFWSIFGIPRRWGHRCTLFCSGTVQAFESNKLWTCKKLSFNFFEFLSLGANHNDGKASKFRIIFAKLKPRYPSPPNHYLNYPVYSICKSNFLTFRSFLVNFYANAKLAPMW